MCLFSRAVRKLAIVTSQSFSWKLTFSSLFLCLIMAFFRARAASCIMHLAVCLLYSHWIFSFITGWIQMGDFTAKQKNKRVFRSNMVLSDTTWAAYYIFRIFVLGTYFVYHEQKVVTKVPIHWKTKKQDNRTWVNQ